MSSEPSRRRSVAVSARRSFGLNKIPVSLGERSYEIVIGHGILDKLGDAAKGLGLGRKVMIVTGSALWPSYGKVIHDSMTSSGFDVSVALINDEEESKSLQTVTSLYNNLIQNELDRSSGIVAVGGGVVGDVAGFAAATFMRGIRVIQVPTTLLAQVDSSIGGKTGVNHPRGKNLIGALHQPTLVWTDVSTLRTLTERELRSGLAEVVKYAIIADAELFHILETTVDAFSKASTDIVIEIVSRCCATKAKIVEKDEKEHGVRSILNYGHTVGHALEALTDYAYYTHGEAIAIGMSAAARISCAIGTTDQKMVENQERLIKMSRLPTLVDSSVAPREIVDRLSSDKKRLGGRVRWVLPKAIGEVFLTDQVPPNVALDVLSTMIVSRKGEH